jgi:hypothetical protein
MTNEISSQNISQVEMNEQHTVNGTVREIRQRHRTFTLSPSSSLAPLASWVFAPRLLADEKKMC